MHTDALRAHAQRLHRPAEQLAKAGADAASVRGVEAFGTVGTAVASVVLGLAELTENRLTMTAKAIQDMAAGVERMADDYDSVEGTIRKAFTG